MSSARTMSTQDIKRGLQNIKKAQLQVLKQLRGDSFMLQENKSPHKSTIIQKSKYTQTNQNNHLSSNIEINKSNVSAQSFVKNEKKSFQSNQFKSIQTKDSSSQIIEKSAQLQNFRKEMTLQRQEVKRKFIELGNKMSQLQKQSVQMKSQQRVLTAQYQKKLSVLKQQTKNLSQSKQSLEQELKQSQAQQRKLRNDVQMKLKTITILQTQLKSVRSENTKLSLKVKQYEAQIKEQSYYIKQHNEKDKEREKQLISMRSNQQQQQSRINMDLVMKQVKNISNSHDFLFNKLKQSASLQMTWVEKQQQVQNSLSRLLQYFQNMSTSSSGNYINQQNFYFNNGKNTSTQNIKKSYIVGQSRDQDREQLEYFVKQMNDNNYRKERQQLKEQNQSLRRDIDGLKKRISELTNELIAVSSYNQNKNNSRPQSNKYLTESNRLISLQLQEMREEVVKLKRYKQQLKSQHQEIQAETVKHKIKARQLEAKAQTLERKLTETNHMKFNLQKKTQQQSIEITSLNSIIKDLNTKLTGPQIQSSSLNKLRQQFTKLLQTNSLLLRQKQSLKAINQGLQAQIQTLKYEKQQFQANNKQKHDLIERQIKERNHLLEQLQKKELKITNLNSDVQKLRNTITLNDETSLKARQHFQNLLQQKNQQTLQLRKEIQDLYKQTRQYHQLRFKHDKLQLQFKELSRKSCKMGQTLSHLWSVKQAEYHNVNQLLGILKNNNDFAEQGQNSGNR